MRTIYYYDFNKEPSFRKEKIRSKFLNAYRHKLKINLKASNRDYKPFLGF